MAAKSKAARLGRGEAGRQGETVRSDLHVSVELTDDGGVQLELQSRVEPYYGDSIREQVASVLAALGVKHARVDVHDQGALPYVIQARLEAAVRRAGAGDGCDARPERSAPLPPASARDRLRRSRLYLPGNEPKFAISAGLHGPDGIILDLEDSVHPDAKDAARFPAMVRHACQRVPLGESDPLEVPNSPFLGSRLCGFQTGHGGVEVAAEGRRGARPVTALLAAPLLPAAE